MFPDARDGARGGTIRVRRDGKRGRPGLDCTGICRGRTSCAGPVVARAGRRRRWPALPAGWMVRAGFRRVWAIPALAVGWRSRRWGTRMDEADGGTSGSQSSPHGVFAGNEHASAGQIVARPAERQTDKGSTCAPVAFALAFVETCHQHAHKAQDKTPLLHREAIEQVQELGVIAMFRHFRYLRNIPLCFSIP